METKLKRLPAFFYQLASGREPVLDWIKSLSPEDRKIVGEDIKDVEFGWPIGLPLCRSLGHGLWEVRHHLNGGRIARTIFSVVGNKMFLLHAFIKKTQKTPQADITLALKRLNEFMS